MSTFDEVESEDSGEDESVTIAEVTGVIKKLLCVWMPGVDKTCPEMLKAVDVVKVTNLNVT